MAKRKANIEEIEDKVDVATPAIEPNEIIETTVAETEVTEIPETEVETETPAPKAKKEKTKEPKQDIPENILSLLKVFDNYPELRVTPNGQVYTPDCKLAVAKADILYKNPYYKS